MGKENEELHHAIKAIHHDNGNLEETCEAALGDLKKLEAESPDKDLHHKNELCKTKKEIEIANNRKPFLIEKIRMLELEKFVYKDADCRARNRFLTEQMEENNCRRTLLLEAIDAAYHQWLDKLAELKHEINHQRPEKDVDHKYYDELKHLHDKLVELEE